VRYDNIQLLRFVAALGVVLFHLGSYAETTFKADRAALWPLHPLVIAGFPVPLFFAVSGFVLTQTLNSSANPRRVSRAGRFLFARFLRLYPGYWLALAAVVLLMRVRVYTEFDRWLIYLVNLTELTLWPAGPGKCPYLLSVEWSLIYEVFLSVALAVLSLFGLRRGLPIACGVWLGVLAVKMVVRPGYGTTAFPHWTTIALSAYSVPFLLGVLVYYVKDHGRRGGGLYWGLWVCC
jgi:peptidoglycan/LPS O-acetylase OafA/YrhL